MRQKKETFSEDIDSELIIEIHPLIEKYVKLNESLNTKEVQLLSQVMFDYANNKVPLDSYINYPFLIGSVPNGNAISPTKHLTNQDWLSFLGFEKYKDMYDKYYFEFMEYENNIMLDNMKHSLSTQIYQTKKYSEKELIVFNTIREIEDKKQITTHKLIECFQHIIIDGYKKDYPFRFKLLFFLITSRIIEFDINLFKVIYNKYLLV